MDQEIIETENIEEIEAIVQELLEKFEVTDEGPNNAGLRIIKNNIEEDKDE